MTTARLPVQKTAYGQGGIPGFVVGALAVWLVSAGLPAEGGTVDETAAKSTSAGSDFFESKVRPVLARHCYGCHSKASGKARGELQLDTLEAMRAGGGRGPAVVPRDPVASWLLVAVSHTDPDLRMPPKGDRLPAAVLADLRHWIELGAPGPKTSPSDLQPHAATGRETRFWAYQTPASHAAPAVKDPNWPRQDVDRFLLAGLEASGLAPSLDARPEIVLRRLHYDLIGLPPDPGVVETFLKRVETEGLDRAMARETDALLASPQFGERWGRHWLDVARFGESSGKESNISFPYAWRYRDYVIDCVASDVPFDRFLTEQIAGDLLPYDTSAERARLLIATGFLAVGPKNLDEMNEKQFLADLADEQIDTLTRSVLGTTIACARCHDHKFDPFRMEDYYGLAGIFGSTRTFFGTAVSPANRVGGDPLPLPRDAGQAVLHPSISAAEVRKLKAELAALKKEGEEGKKAIFRAALSGKDPGKVFTLRDALRIFWRSGAIEGQLEKVDDEGKALPLAMGVLDHERVGDARLLRRGEVGRPGDPVPRAFPKAIGSTGDSRIPTDQSGRLELARWLTAPDHPLTSRVFVNRVWKHLFGAGLVATVDDFGSTGARPSHPELLDDLAVSFVREGWSTKRLVRKLVLSRAYRQASTYRDEAFERDPENRLLWRAAKRRLEAEAIRDAMLAVSGRLELTRPNASLVGRVIGDRPISLIGLDKRLPADLDGSRTRSVYLPVIRNRLPDALELFDFAEPSLVTGERETTNVPLQALFLMNGPFVQDQAEALAERLSRESRNGEAIVSRAFLLCFGRRPDAEELRRSLTYLDRSESSEGGESATDRQRLASFCQALMSTAEFRNLD